MVTVAATDIHNNLLPSSNWGKSKVDLAALGENIYSTLPGGRFGYMSGTSQATAFVSGVAALALSACPRMRPRDFRALLYATVNRLPQLEKRVGSGGRLDAGAALRLLSERGCDRQAW